MPKNMSMCCCLQVRLNFLSPLLAMSYQHLHNTLTASVLNCKLFTMPFHRDVELTPHGAHAMLGALAYCQQVLQQCNGFPVICLCMCAFCLLDHVSMN